MDVTNKKMPHIPASWGEIIDKITILEIKSNRILDRDAQKNIISELNALRPFELEIMTVELSQLKTKLLSINASLWNIEEELRQCEVTQEFDDNFIRLARSVYFSNDERAKIKREINIKTKSILIEEKSYRSYEIK